jgi:riboflavin kinase/FMN adenylyltransferase
LEWVHGTAALGRKLVRPVLTIGNFDGLHRGHQAIMGIVVERARALEGDAVVFTFEPHPRKIVQPETAPRLLLTREQKHEQLEALGVDITIAEPFDSSFAKVSPDEFVRDYIHSRVRPLEVYVGYDFHFGRDREGSMRSLTTSGPQLGFAVTIIPEVKVGGRDVNSTRIRELLSRGEVEAAEDLLGHAYALRGAVVEGDQRGRLLGFPTANLRPENEVIPERGVYAGRVRLLDEGQPPRNACFDAVINVGVRPTFDDSQGLLVEAHLLNFDADLYGKRLEVSFHHRLRSERKFAKVEELQTQIAADADHARARLKKS